MSRPLFGGLSANEKEEKFASNDNNIYYAAYVLCKEYLNNFQDEITLMGELSRSGSTSAHY